MPSLFALGLPVTAVAMFLATTAGAAPCEDGMANIEYALAIAVGEPTPPLVLPIRSDICVDKCNEECDSNNNPTSWDACYYPCIQGCISADVPGVPSPTPYEPE